MTSYYTTLYYIILYYIILYPIIILSYIIYAYIYIFIKRRPCPSPGSNLIPWPHLILGPTMSPRSTLYIPIVASGGYIVCYCCIVCWGFVQHGLVATFVQSGGALSSNSKCPDPICPRPPSPFGCHGGGGDPHGAASPPDFADGIAAWLHLLEVQSVPKYVVIAMAMKMA